MPKSKLIAEFNLEGVFLGGAGKHIIVKQILIFFLNGIWTAKMFHPMQGCIRVFTGWIFKKINHELDYPTLWTF